MPRKRFWLRRPPRAADGPRLSPRPSPQERPCASQEVAQHREDLQRSQDQPIRPNRVGTADGRNHRRRREGHFQAGECRGAQGLVAAGHQGGRVEVFLRRAGHTRAGDFRAPAHPPHLPHDRGLGGQGRLLHQSRRRSVLRRTDLAVPESVRRLQLARLVQRRAVSPVSRRQLVQPRQLVLRSQDRPGGAGEDAVRISAVQRLLHPVGRGQHGVHHAPGPQRGDALQVRLRHRHRSFAHPLQQGEAQRRRPAQRSAVVPEGL